MTSSSSRTSAREPSASAPSRVVAIVGPTGVGKTAVAEELAVRLHGEIVTADSMQVYRFMDVGTAKPAPADRRVPHHCIDLVDPGEPFSAALFQSAARAAISDITSRGLLPIMAGGTGLYVRAAVDDMSFPAGDQVGNPVRAEYERLAEHGGPAAVYDLLRSRDPDSAAAIHPNNTRRVIRALEMLDGGASYAQQLKGFSERRSIYDCRFIGLAMERERLYQRIDARVDDMIAAGLLGEVRSLMDRGFRGAVTAAQAIGYKELVPVIERGADLDEACAAIKLASRRYAKRQLTWFRSDPRVIWLDVTHLSLGEAADAAVAALD